MTYLVIDIRLKYKSYSKNNPNNNASSARNIIIAAAEKHRNCFVCCLSQAFMASNTKK